MSAISKAVKALQDAPVGVPVGRYQPQVKVIAEFVALVSEVQTKNNTLLAELLEAHERINQLLGFQGDVGKPSGKLAGKSFDFVVLDEFAGTGSCAMYCTTTPLPEPKMPPGYKFAVMPSPFKMYSFAEWVAGGWTVAQMIKYGVIIPKFVAAMPPGYQFRNRSGDASQDLKRWASAGWSIEQMIAHGYLVKV